MTFPEVSGSPEVSGIPEVSGEGGSESVRGADGRGQSSGIALVAKPSGITSFQALAPLKRSLGTRKLGHTGTLDRFASGLLVILVGSCTRLGPWFTGLDKLYRAVVRFGEESDTLDPEGTVVARAAPPEIAALLDAIPAFRGTIMQSPPAYSAIHIDGQRASDRARRGEIVSPSPRPVTIHELEMESFDGRDAVIRVRCSSGTYIRSLARDLAIAAGSRARLEALERLAVGPYDLRRAKEPEAVSLADLLSLDESSARALGLLPLRLRELAERAFANGGRLRLEDFERMQGEPLQAAGCVGRSIAVFSRGGSFRGMMEAVGDELSYRFVIGAGS